MNIPVLFGGGGFCESGPPEDRGPDSYQSGLDFELFAQLRETTPYGMQASFGAFSQLV